MAHLLGKIFFASVLVFGGVTVLVNIPALLDLAGVLLLPYR